MSMGMEDVARLGVSVDTSTVKTAKGDLRQLGDEAVKTSEKTNNTNKAFTQFNDCLTDAERKAKAAKEAQATLAMQQNALKDSTQSLTIGQQMFLERLRDQAAAAGMSKKELLELQAAQLGLSDAAKPMIEQIQAATQSHHKFNIATAGSTREMMVLGHEAVTGNFSKLGGSMMVFANQTGAAHIAITALGTASGLAFAGLATVFAVLGYAAFQANSELTSFKKAVEDTNNSAGVSSNDLFNMAQALSSVTRQSHESREALAILASSGQFTSDQLFLAGKTAVEMSENTGKSVEETTKSLIDMSEDVLKFADKYQKSHHTMSGLDRERIKTMQDTGDAVGAATYMMRLMEEQSSRLKEASERDVGILKAAYLGWGMMINSASNGLAELGKTMVSGEDPTQRMVRLTKEQTQIMRELTDATKRQNQAEIEWLKNRLNKNMSDLGSAQGDYVKKRESDLTTQAKGISGDIGVTSSAMTSDTSHMGDKQRMELALKENEATLAKLQSQYKKFNETIEAGAKVSSEEILKVEENHAAGYAAYLAKKEGIEKDFAEKANKRGDDDRARKLQGILSGYEGEIAAAKRMNDEAQEMDDIRYKNGGLSEVTYFENKIRRMESMKDKQIESYNGEIVALQNFHGRTNAERAKNENDIKNLFRKREVTEEQFYAKVEALELEREYASAKSLDKQLDARDKDLESLNKQLSTERDRLAQMGQTKGAVDELVASQYEKAASEKEGLATVMDSIDWSGKLGDAYRREAAALRELAGIKRSQGAKQNQLDDAKEAEKLHASLNKLFDPSRGMEFGNAIKGSVGEAISSISKLDAAMRSYSKNQEAYDSQVAMAKEALRRDGDEKKYAFEMDRINKKSSENQIANYAQIAGAAKGFFAEGTKGYQALEVAENTFRMVQLASDLEKGLSAAAVGIASQAQGDPYTAIPRMALMAAAMASLGFATGFFGSSGSGGQTAEQRQKEQGTGSVYGDLAAKSESIARSIEDMKNTSDDLLPVNQGMLAALKNIESSMAGFTNLVVRTQGVVNGSNLGISEGKVASNFGSGVFSFANSLTGGIFASAIDPIGKAIQKLWGGTQTSIVDSGVQFGGKYSDLTSGSGFNQYASVDKTTSSWFGLKKSTTNSVQSQALSTELSSQLGLIFSSMGESLKQANIALGGTAQEVEKTLSGLTLSSEKISLKGLTGQALTDALNGVISKSLDEMAKAVFPQYDQFRNVGEGYAQTVMRVANTFANVDDGFKRIGLSLSKLGQDGVLAAMGFAKLMDGLENFQAVTASYYENFFTEEERNANTLKALTDEFAKQSLGALPATREEYRKLVEHIGEVGTPEQLASILKLSQAFAEAVPETEKAASSVEDLGNSSTYASKAFTSAASAIDKAAADAAAAAAAILTERKGLQDQLDQATMTSAQLLEKQRNALDASNQSLFDEVQAALAAKAAKEQLTQTNAAIQSQIDQIIDSSLSVTQLRAKELAGIDASTAALKTRLYALQDEKAQAESLKKTADDRNNSISSLLSGMAMDLEKTAKNLHEAADKMKGLRDEILMDGSTGLSGQQRLAIAQAQIDNAKPEDLPALTNNYLKILSETSTDLLDYQRGALSVADRYSSAAKDFDERGTQANSKEAYEGLAEFGRILAKDSEEAAKRDAWNAKYAAYAELSAANAYKQDPSVNAQVQKMQDDVFSDPYYKATYIDGSHANGLDYVPFDGYVAQLHKGERVQTATQAKSSDEVAALLRELIVKQEAQNLAIVKNTAETARIMSRWQGDGMPETRTWVAG